ncbi:hypothetical protein TNCV_3409461 [Trichonephila clavipes]|nr:hypothetical protein TNCV_3409461 [Trichonephila clavipes]
MFQNMCRFQCYKSHSHLCRFHMSHTEPPVPIPVSQVPQSPVQIPSVQIPSIQIPLEHIPVVPEHVQIPVSQVPSPPMQIPHVPEPPVQIPVSHVPQSPVQILPMQIPLVHIPDVPEHVQIPVSQVPQPPMQILPEPMQILPELDILDPLESTNAFDQLMSFVFGPQELQLLHTVTSIFDGNLLSLLDEFERAPMDLTMPRLNSCVKKSIGAIQPMDLSVNSCLYLIVYIFSINNESENLRYITVNRHQDWNEVALSQEHLI